MTFMGTETLQDGACSLLPMSFLLGPLFLSVPMREVINIVRTDILLSWFCHALLLYLVILLMSNYIVHGLRLVALGYYAPISMASRHWR